MATKKLRKRCPRCKITKCSDDFYKSSVKKDGLTVYCKACSIAKSAVHYQKNVGQRKEYQRKWRRKNRTKLSDAYTMRRYGIDGDKYRAMLESQNGVCAICGRIESRSSANGRFRLHVDHDHDTGKIRGLLCHPCNTALGQLREDPKLLDKAAAYLKEHGGS